MFETEITKSIDDVLSYLRERYNLYKIEYAKRNSSNNHYIYCIVESLLKDNRFIHCMFWNIYDMIAIKKPAITSEKFQKLFQGLIFSAITCSYESIIHPISIMSTSEDSVRDPFANQFLDDLDKIHNRIYVLTILFTGRFLDNILSNSSSPQVAPFECALNLFVRVNNKQKEVPLFIDLFKNNRYSVEYTSYNAVNYYFSDLIHIATDNPIPTGLISIDNIFALKIEDLHHKLDYGNNAIQDAYLLPLKFYEYDATFENILRAKRLIIEEEIVPEKDFIKTTIERTCRIESFPVDAKLKMEIDKANGFMQELINRTENVKFKPSQYDDTCLCDRLGRYGYKYFVRETFSKHSQETRMSRVKINQPPEKGNVAISFIDMNNYKLLCKSFKDKEEKLYNNLNQLFTAMFEDDGGILQAMGGYIDKFIGDCVMVVYEGNGTKENMELILRQLCNIARITKPIDGEEEKMLSFALGLHFGEVISGKLHAGTIMSEWAVLGNNVNIASLLQGIADGGEVAISYSTLELCFIKDEKITKSIKDNKEFDYSWMEDGKLQTFYFVPYSGLRKEKEKARKSIQNKIKKDELLVEIKQFNRKIDKIYDFLSSVDRIGCYNNIKAEYSVWIGREKH